MSARGAPLTQARVDGAGRRDRRRGRLRALRGHRRAGDRGARLEEVSVGDYVLSGGEIAALALIDACVRLLPGVMGKQASGAEESFADGLLEYPQYTRPSEWEGRADPRRFCCPATMPDVAAWRRAQAERLTRSAGPICGRPIWRSQGPKRRAEKDDKPASLS